MRKAQKIKIAIVGDGKMGNVTWERALATGFDVVGIAKKSKDCQRWIKNDLHAQCVVDFSHSDCVAGLVEFCEKQKIPLVTGTTGLSVVAQREIINLSKSVAVCQSSNFSVGIALLKRTVRRAVEDAIRFGFAFDCHLTEKHHVTKKDSPSGTAKDILAEIEKSVQKSTLQGVAQKSGAQVHSYRCGEVTGKHEVEFFCKGEELLFSHQAYDKSIFAEGALAVAKKILDYPVGLYSFEHFVFSEE